MPKSKVALPKEKSGHTPKSIPRVGPASAEADFRVVEPRLFLIPRHILVTPNVDVQIAATFAIGLSRTLQADSVRKRFRNLTKCGEYDDRCVDELPVVARAAWYVRHKVLLGQATRSEAQLPLSLVEQATTLRARMLKCVEYHLGDHPEEAATIAALRAGQGYQDLANDLLGFADMYERRRDEIAHDKRAYRSTDAAGARRLAGQILSLLGAQGSPEQGRWVDLQSRAWTLLLQVYDEVRRGGRFLFARENPDTMFPSLVAVARAGAASKSKGESPDAGAGDAAPSTMRPGQVGHA